MIKIKDLKEFELKHKVISFILILMFTILTSRLIVSINDPNLIFWGYELHHFYYGIILLIIVNLFLLFGKKHYASYLSLSAVGMGMIIDEFVFIIGRISNNMYQTTITSAIIFALVVSLLAYSINKIK